MCVVSPDRSWEPLVVDAETETNSRGPENEHAGVDFELKIIIIYDTHASQLSGGRLKEGLADSWK